MNPLAPSSRAAARGLAAILALTGLLMAPFGLLPTALVGLGLLWAARLPSVRPAWEDPGFVLGLFTGLALLVFAGLAFWQCSAKVDGQRWWWLEDDALVSMRYGARLAAGKGLTWTGTQRVEGYSDFLWTLGMALIHVLGSGRAWSSFWVLMAEGACLVWLALATRALARALGAGEMEAALAGAALVLSFDQIAGALSGLECVAVAALSAQALKGAASQRRAELWRGLAWASLLPLLRADGGLPAVLVLALAWPRLGPRRWLAPVLVLAPGLAHLVWRHAYYGAWVPNTYVLKAGYWPGKWSDAAIKLGGALARYPLVLVGAVAALFRAALRPWAAACAVLALYCVWAGADYYGFLRFFAAGWPLLFALAFAVLGAWPRLGRWRIGLAWAMLLLSFNAYASLPALSDRGWASARERLELALAVGRRLAPGETLASLWAGGLYYYSGVEGVDLLGKCDPVVAAQPPNLPLGGEGHNKMDLAWSLGRLKPDWVAFEPPVYHAGVGAYVIDKDDEVLALDPLFRAHCLGHAVQVSPHWALCHCDWAHATPAAITKRERP